MTHDYTRKGGIVHAEIMLPAHAPPEFADRSILWNSVEQIEKARDSQLAREIEAALPRELSREQQLALVRAYGTPPKRWKNNGTPSLRGGGCLPSPERYRPTSMLSLSGSFASSSLFPKA